MADWVRLLIPSEAGARSIRAPLPQALVARLLGAAKSVSRPPGRPGVEPRFSVYVVLLDFGARDWRLYVGMTGVTPEERYLNHKAGYKASKWVNKHGIGLLPALYKRVNPLDWEPAMEVEVALAGALRSAGVRVIQG